MIRPIILLLLFSAPLSADPGEMREVTERVWVPAQYREVTKKEYIAPRYQTVSTREWVPEQYREGTERVYVPPRYTTQRVPVCTTRYRIRWVPVRRHCGGGFRQIREPYRATTYTTRRVLVPGTGVWTTKRTRQLVPGTGQHVVRNERRLVSGTGVWVDRTERLRVPGTGEWKRVVRRIAATPPLVVSGQAAPRPHLPRAQAGVLALRDARFVARALLRERVLAMIVDGRRLRDLASTDDGLLRLVDARIAAADEAGARLLEDGSAQVSLSVPVDPLLDAVRAHLGK